MDIRIRELERSDLHYAAELDRRAFEDGWSEKMFSAELEKDFAYYFAAEDGGGLLGFAGVWCVYETADVARIAVEPSARRRGIGEALMRALIEKAGEKGCCRMMLEVDETNSAARSMYRKLGFTEIDLRKNYYGEHSAVIMELNLIEGN